MDQPRPTTHPGPDAPAPHPADHFLRLMFFQPSEPEARHHLPPEALVPTRRYRGLAQHRLRPTESCSLPPPTAARIDPDSPALAVMTDLRSAVAIRVDPLAGIDEANRTMIAHGIRALFVVDERRRVVGLVTSYDVLGETPMQAIQQRGIRHDEVTVGDIMTPADRLEYLALKDVRRASVGDVVVTLVHAGRQHAIVCDDDGTTATRREKVVGGLFSLTQIARQLGVPLDATEMRRSFAWIESALS
jgi:CBS domain-containing protein